MDSSPHAADRLLAAVERVGSPVCVGLDPVVDRLPSSVIAESSGPVDSIERFSIAVIDAVAGAVPCIKPQSACFERYGSAGVAALERVLAHGRRAGLEIILDAKRGDIGISAEHYAEGIFGSADVDWVTVNGYLGGDGIAPFLRPARGAFALVRTSNPGGDSLQGRALVSGGTVADAVARVVADLGDQCVGASGFSSLGAVVGATRPEDARRLRTLMPRQLFLVPGFGAQGGGVADVLPCFRADGRGAIVTASRSVIYPPSQDPARWRDAIGVAARSFAEEIRSGLAARR